MTSNKQVSPAIRILRGERDASARATHLEAATRKFLVTTNERKYMSTKTNFKRIALVAVAALGLGVLSSVPSQAAVIGNVTISAGSTAATATRILADSTTQATVTVAFTANATTDSVLVTAFQTSGPTGAAANTALIRYVDTLTSLASTGFIFATVGGAVGRGATLSGNGDSAVVGTTGVFVEGGTGYNVIKLGVQLQRDTVTTAPAVGTYTYNVVAQPISAARAAVASEAVSTTVTITVAALAAESRVPSAATSTAIFSASGGATEEAVTGVATASTTSVGNIQIKLRNASGASSTLPAQESVTVTTTVGTVGINGGVFGRSVVLPYTSNGVGAGDSITVQLRPDGSVGTATITISTPSVTFAPKSAVFYSAAPTSLVATALNTVPGVGSNAAAIGVVAKDSAGNAWAGTLYAYSSATATISDTGTSCSYVAANGRHECTITGAAAGTATVTFRNSTAATGIAATTVSSNAVSMTVSTAAAATVKLSFNKATYAPGEKATLLVQVLDSTGKSVPANTYANLFAAGGITLSVAPGNGSDTTTAVSRTTASLASLALGTSTEPVSAYTIYMPASGGTVTAEATGGTSLPVAGQVKVTASATVTDSGAAALAAVNALATTVASLKTLITTLTNLVLKIQKKVKA
jgi:trimeric autotransporter adhesin